MSTDEEARSTERPPAQDDSEVDLHDAHPDIAAAIKRAKTNASPGRYGPPSATAKINKFDLAQALALTTSDGEHVPSSSKPPRDDDAPFVAGEVEVVGEEEVNSGVPSGGAAKESVPPGSKPSKKPPKAISKPPIIDVITAEAEDETAVVPKANSGNLVLVILGAIIGLIVVAYVYVTTR